MAKGNHTKEIIGSWMQAIGNAIEAYGSTPSVPLDSETRDDYNRVGLTMQATGAGLVADGQSTVYSYEYAGSVITSIGSLEELLPLIWRFSSLEADYVLESGGNILQGLGTTLSAYDEIINGTPSGAYEGIIGNTLQTIGCMISVLGIKVELTDQYNGQWINAIGSWVQTLGAFIAAIGQQLEEEEETEEGDGETGEKPTEYGRCNAPFFLR